MHFGDEEASLGVLRESRDLEVEPGLGIDRFARKSGVLAAFKPKLHEGIHT